MTAPPQTSALAAEPMPIRRRSSFATRLLLALVGLVVFVAGTMLLLIGQQTAEQVRVTTDRAAAISRRAFDEVEELHRAQLARLARAFTDSRRTLAALEAALESGDPDWLAETARYELQLARIANSVAAFTDAQGNVVTTLVDGTPVDGDPAGIREFAETALGRGDAVTTGYRVIGGRLFSLTLERVELGGRPIGTVSLGVPLDEDLTRHLGEAAGVDVCFVAAGQCVAGTAAAGTSLAQRMEAHAAADPPEMVTDEEGRWVLVSDEVQGASSGEVRRVIGVPIDEVLAPFERIRAVVLWTALGALGLALGIAVVLSNRLARPVRELVGATRRIARGDLDTRVPVHRQDELGALAASFNTMAEDLALKERYRDVLKKVVSREVAEDLMAGELQLGGEVRTVTVVFADIVGFTTLAEGERPQRVIALLNQCMTEWSRAIEEEGGVVDKYIGDAIMGVFGAPVSHTDDALRAVRAAVRMQETAGHIETASGESVQLAIGISTGEAIAGNMGSPDRLNYTVVGESVNLASRLCAAAGAGETLISSETAGEVRGQVRLSDLGEKQLKGLARPVSVFGVQTEPRARPPVRAPAILLTAVLMASTVATAEAQERRGGLPTLAGLGASYMSGSGNVQIDWSGRLDVEGYFPQDSPPWLIPGTDAFVAGRLRLFTDVFLGDHVYSLIEVRADRGEAPAAGDVEVRIEQAFLRIVPSARARVHVQAGKFALPFGGYANRHHSPEDPLIRPPLAYDYRTLVSATIVPAAPAGFLNWKNEAAVRRPNGSPQVWNVPYPWGALAVVQLGALAVHAAVTSAAASSGPEQWELDADRFSSPSYTLGAAWQLAPELRAAVAFHRGPYLARVETGPMPAGSDATDFAQQMWNAEIVFKRGRTTLRGEAFVDRWEVPNLPQDPGDVSWYIEAEQRVAAGLFVAARWNELRFDDLEVNGAADTWDRDVRRVQLGAGYRLLANTELRAEYMINRTAGPDPRDNLFSLQWWWEF